MSPSSLKPISVISGYDSVRRRVAPLKISYCQKIYPVDRVGLHHTFRKGNTLYHIFSVTSGHLFFRLQLNTENLFWFLEFVGDEI